MELKLVEEIQRVLVDGTVLPWRRGVTVRSYPWPWSFSICIHDMGENMKLEKNKRLLFHIDLDKVG